PLPPVPVVDGDGVIPGQVGNIQLRVGALADAILRLPAGVARVIAIAALVAQDHLNRPKKALVRDSTHIVTVTSFRLPLPRTCGGPSALGRYPFRSAYPPETSSALPLTSVRS